MGVQIAVVSGGPRIGDLEAGAVANAFGNTALIVSGGLACIVGALAVARLLPGFRHQPVPTSVADSTAPDHESADPDAGEAEDVSSDAIG